MQRSPVSCDNRLKRKQVFVSAVKKKKFSETQSHLDYAVQSMFFFFYVRSNIEDMLLMHQPSPHQTWNTVISQTSHVPPPSCLKYSSCQSTLVYIPVQNCCIIVAQFFSRFEVLLTDPAALKVEGFPPNMLFTIHKWLLFSRCTLEFVLVYIYLFCRSHIFLYCVQCNCNMHTEKDVYYYFEQCASEKMCLFRCIGDFRLAS